MIAALAAVALSAIARPDFERLEAMAWQEADAHAEVLHQKDIKTDQDVGAKYAADVDKACKFSTDLQTLKRIQRIGAEMAEIANQTHSIATWGDKRFNTFNYTFKVIEDPEPNAFSLPGGFIYVQSGLMKIIESDDELAGVLAHEISHAKFRHVATLQRESSALSMYQLPIILAAVLSGSPTAALVFQTSSFAQLTLVNGWTVKAEQAADYGGIQLMVKSKYNPTGMLTLMEHLGVLENSQPQFSQNQGIFRTHPPSKERADSMIKYLKEAKIPIQRSKVSSSFRAIVKPDDKISGAVVITFSNRNLFVFAGNDALTRADAAADKLNAFLDSTPDMYEVTSGTDGAILGRGQKLFQFVQDDASAQSKSIADLQQQSVTTIKNALYTTQFRIWSNH